MQLLAQSDKQAMLTHPLTHDVKWVTPKVKELAMSWSKISDFDTCPRKYHASYIAKLEPFDDTNPALIWGRKVHKNLEDYVLKGLPLSRDTEQFKPIADALLGAAERAKQRGALTAGVVGEQQWAINARGEAVDYFSKEVFMRGQADLCYGVNDTLVFADYKTGKANYPKPDQLELLALLAKGRPSYQKFTQYRGALLFVEAGRIVKRDGQLDEHGHADLMRKYLSKSIEIVEMYESGDWRMKESPLCRFCPDTACPFNRKGE